MQLVRADEGEAGKALISHPDMDSVILTGASETAKLFRSWKPDMVLNAETSGKNAIIVTPAADPDLAVADVYKSAFGHAGQKCSAASLVILVGSVGESQRFLGQLVDAVPTLKVGYGTDISTSMNGLIEPPSEKLQRGLTKLEPGERWLVQPRQLDDEGKLWSPGVRDGVAPGSWYHTHECFGPVLGIMHAKDLDEAIAWQNATGFGLTGGIHSLDDDEIAHWIDKVEVGNAYVNRGITGAIVQRQSFGGWKNSAIGAGAKAGGPNYVGQLGHWEDGELKGLDVSLRPRVAQFLYDAAFDLSEVLSKDDLQWVRRAAELDEFAYSAHFGRDHDRTALGSEANIFRCKPLLEPLRVRVGAGLEPSEAIRNVVRLVVGSLLTGTELDISADPKVVEQLRAAGLGPDATRHGVLIREATDSDFAGEVAGSEFSRIRTIGEVDPDLRKAAVESSSVILDGPVLADGRRELLHQLLEQAVSVTMHRFGVKRGVGHIERD